MPARVAPRVLSGIQPTADSFHLGNYLGALRQWVAMQDTHDAFYCVVDLHAITVEHDPATAAPPHQGRRGAAARDGPRPRALHAVFVQSHVPEHAELAWVLGCLTGFGEARPDDPVQGQVGQAGRRAGPPSGLFTYPILQAADILLYQADQVPGRARTSASTWS